MMTCTDGLARPKNNDGKTAEAASALIMFNFNIISWFNSIFVKSNASFQGL